MNIKVIGFLRGLAYSAIVGILAFVGNAANLHGLVPDAFIGIITAIAGYYDHQLEAEGQGAVFGMIA